MNTHTCETKLFTLHQLIFTVNQCQRSIYLKNRNKIKSTQIKKEGGTNNPIFLKTTEIYREKTKDEVAL